MLQKTEEASKNKGRSRTLKWVANEGNRLEMRCPRQPGELPTLIARFVPLKQRALPGLQKCQAVPDGQLLRPGFAGVLVGDLKTLPRLTVPFHWRSGNISKSSVFSTTKLIRVKQMQAKPQQPINCSVNSVDCPAVILLSPLFYISQI